MIKVSVFVITSNITPNHLPSTNSHIHVYDHYLFLCMSLKGKWDQNRGQFKFYSNIFSHTFRVTARYLYFRTALTSLQWSYMVHDNWAAFRYICEKGKIWPLWPWKMTFRAIQANLSLTIHVYPSWAALFQNREKSTEQFWSKWPPKAKKQNFTFPTLKNDV